MAEWAALAVPNQTSPHALVPNAAAPRYSWESKFPNQPSSPLTRNFQSSILRLPRMQLLTRFPGEDALDDVLRHLYVGGAVYCRSDLRPPWAFSMDRKPIAGFHAITRGRGWLQVEGEARHIPVKAGDLVVLPHGHGHVVRDNPKTPPAPLDQIVTDNPLEDGIRLKMGDRGPLTILLCGGFRLEGGSANPLLANLPAVIHIRGKKSRSALWLQMTMRQLELETRSSRPGAQTLIGKFSDILFIQAVRTYFNGLADDHPGTESGGWIRALRDPQIGVAIAFLHRQPEHDWQVGSLASQVGMSRSSFSARFRAFVGEPPLKYLAKWRALKAAWFLRTSDATLAEIAGRVGYESEIALSKAFKRFMGQSPGAYRQQQRRNSA
jgi:AraC-like DNA-binding protein/mannose-6-phosphate isomerase-like protein (cupin superfamily)